MATENTPPASRAGNSADPENRKAEAPKGERQIVQHLLQAGLAIACALLLAGFVLQLVRGDLDESAFNLRDLFSRALPLGERLMAGGIVVLALTPAARVLALLTLWVRERDWRFAAVAGAVVITLSIAMAVGHG